MVDRVKPFPGMVIQESVEFDPGIYYFPAGAGLHIVGSGIVVCGNDTVLVGPGQPGNLDSFQGVAISACGQHHVTVEGLTVHGFQLAMKVTGGHDWNVLNNDFSYNYTDEAYGWGEGFPFGAVLLERVERSRLVGNTAVSNWNGLVLYESNDNEIRNNRFSHCTNVCLKLWNSSKNRIEDNNFSYGLRISPGETHARDSTCALLESGSNDNRFLRNDFTHGGDGVFIRPLNGWHSRRNYFERNDASFAHNNAWECWSPDNTFVRNRGNFSSYGFWLGGSDGTVMIGNEAAYNGTQYRNAPEPDFGHAGIAIVHGSSSHLRLAGNRVHHNNGPGLALGFKDDYPAMHSVIVGNSLRFNRQGIYLRHVDQLTLAANDLTDNDEQEILQGPAVFHVHEIPAGVGAAETSCLEDITTSVSGCLKQIGQHAFVVAQGQALTVVVQPGALWAFDKIHVEWFEHGQPTTSGWQYVATYAEPGYHRLCVTVSDGTSVNLAWIDVYVIDNVQPETGTEGSVDPWTLLPLNDGDALPNIGSTNCVLDSDVRIVGEHSLRLSTVETSFRLRTVCHEVWSDLMLLQFWIRIRHHTVFGLRGVKHRVRVGQSEQDYVQYDRNGHVFEGILHNEAWEDWLFVQIPSGGDACWTRTVVGSGCPGRIAYVEFVHEGTGEEFGRCDLWFDGLQLVERLSSA